MAAYAIQFRRGTTTQHSSFTGLLGEVTVDTDKKTLVVHDGSTTGGFPLSREGAAATSSTGSFTSNVSVGGTLAVTSTSTFSDDVGVTGDLTMTGHILPSANITYDLGSTTHMWRDIYVGPGSLYVNGKKVIEDDSGSISITTEANEDLKVSTTGTGTLKFISGNGINFTGELGAVSGDLQIGDHIDMNSSLIKELAAPVSGTDAANKNYVDAVAASAVTGGSNAVSGTTGAFSSDVTITGDLTVNGTTTSINTTQIDLADNILLLNSDATGTASVNAGIEVERGDDANVSIVWDETNDKWTIGSHTFVASTFEGDLTGDVTGTVSSIANHDTDDLSEGSTNKYFSNTLARGAVSAGGDLSYNSSTGAFSFTERTDAEVTTLAKAAISAGGDLSYADGVVSFTERTDGEVRGLVSVSGDLAYNSTTGVISFTQNDAWSNITGTPTTVSGYGITDAYTKSEVDAAIQTKDALSELSGTTDDVTEGSTNKYFSNALARGAISVSGDISYNSSTGVISTTGLASSDTDDLSEGSTNLYYTNARADARIAAADTDDLSEGSSNQYFTTARARASISASGSLAYNSSTGALTYTQGNTDTVAEGSSNLYYTTARWDTKMAAADTDDLSEGSNLYYTTARWDTKMAAADTDDLSEGSTNLYYTDARADARAQLKIDSLVDSAPGALDTLNELAAALGDDADFAGTVTDSLALKFASADFNSTFDTRLGTKSTTDLSEGTNLYYTDARVDAYINASILTTDVSEGTNLYYTDARADARITNALKDEDNMASNSATHVPSQQSVKAYVDSQVSSKDNTDEITEGSTNLYYTDARVDSYINASILTTDVSEGTNLYYTTARWDTKMAAADTDDLSEGSTNKYFSNTLARGAVSAGGDLSYNSTTGVISFTERTDAEVTTLAKAAISASGDLSYADGVVSFTERTDAEVTTLAKAAISSSGDLSYSDGVVSFTERTDGEVRGLVSASGDLSYNSTTGAFSFTERTDGEVRGLVSASGDLSYNSTTGVISFTERTNAEVRGLVSVTDAGGDGSLSYNSTSGVITYTGPSSTEVRAHLSAGTGVTYSSGEFSIGQAVATTSDVTFNDLVVSGDLTVSGTTTSINTTEINLADNILLLNSDATGTATASAGLEVERGDDLNVQLLWDEANDRWTTGAEDFYTTGTITGDLTGDVTGTVSSISNHDTGDLTEGSNLYYTNTRADARVNLQTGANLDLSSMTTANLTEDSSNLYYTTSRWDTKMAAADTGDLSEGSNLYHTTTRARAAISASGDLSYADGVVSFTERTDAEVRGLVSASGDLSYNSTTGVISFTERTNAEVRNLISVTDAGGDGSLSYNASTGVITYTGPSSTEVRAHFSAGGDLSYNSSTGVFSYTTPAEVDNYVDSLSFSGGTLTVGRTGALTDLTVDITTATTMKHTHGYSVTSDDENDNTGSTHAITWATLNGTDKVDFGTDAVAYSSEIDVAPFVQVFINRMILRPNEVTISSSGVTFEDDIIAEGDEIEIMYMDEK